MPYRLLRAAIQTLTSQSTNDRYPPHPDLQRQRHECPLGVNSVDCKPAFRMSESNRERRFGACRFDVGFWRINAKAQILRGCARVIFPASAHVLVMF